jgi:hypothetical protein
MKTMQPNMRRNLPGTFLAQDLGQGTWRLSRSEPTPIDVFLRGADAAAAEDLRGAEVRDIGIEWRAQTVLLTVTSAGRNITIGTRSAIVHEPLGHLYDALPLATLDAKARRFWRRVFRLVRIPGGRYLLAAVARRRGRG